MKKLSAKIPVVLEVLAVLCLLLGGIGLILHEAGQQSTLVQADTETPQEPTSIPTLTDVPVPEPTETPTLEPLSTPTSASDTSALPRIPVVTPAKITARLQERNLVCAAVTYTMLGDQGYYSWSCKRDDYDIQYFVTITSRDQTSVDAISASVIQTNLLADKQAASFLEFVAALPFLDQPVQQANARGWVRNTLLALNGVTGAAQTTSINFVDYQLYGQPTARTLFIGNLK